MNELMIMGVLVVISAVMIIYSLLPSRSDAEEHVRRRLSFRKSLKPKKLTAPREKKSAAKQVLEKVAPYAMKPVMPKSDEEMTTLRQKMAQGGFRHESAVTYFLASKTVIAVALALLALVLSWDGDKDPKQIAGIALCACGVGFMLPNVWLMLAKKQRMESIRDGMRDA
ncbi:MAG: hypothetical protein JSV03_16835 [Planctomycetota bacterium]|nr:MAG: hypothetical protein JSV03_16835 [Planctomycetota bacterium]